MKNTVILSRLLYRIRQHFNFLTTKKLLISFLVIMIKKVKQTKAEAFDDLFRDFKGNWHCKEINTGVNIGNEVIK